MQKQQDKIKRGVGKVASLLRLSRRTTWRLFRQSYPETGKKHPLGELMWKDDGRLCIHEMQVEAYFNRCRRRQGLGPLAPICPIWGKSDILRRTGMTPGELQKVIDRTSESELAPLIWVDPILQKPILDENALRGIEVRTGVE